MVSINDKFGRPSLPTEYAQATTVKTARTPSESVLACFDLSKFSTDTPVYVITYKKVVDPNDPDKVTIIDQTSWKAIVNADNNTLTDLTLGAGFTDIGNAVGDYVECIPTSFWGNDLVDGLLRSHNPDGTLKDGIIKPQMLGFPGAMYSNTVYFNNSGTYTKPADLRFVVVEVVGGGGSGGNTTTTTSSQASSSGGGGGGGYARKKILAADLAASETVTVGAGALDNSGPGSPGLRGGHSTFGSHCTGEGGWPGSGDGATGTNSFATGGNGGAALGGDINIRGQRGGHGEVIGGSRLLYNHGGGTAITPSNSSASGSGGSSDGETPGQGGSGTTGSGSTSASRGGKGYKGIVIVHEYF